MVYCGSKLEKSRGLLNYIKPIDHTFLWFIDMINHLKCCKKGEEFVHHPPAARYLQILLVFCQHLAWFISL